MKRRLGALLFCKSPGKRNKIVKKVIKKKKTLAKEKDL